MRIKDLGIRLICGSTLRSCTIASGWCHKPLSCKCTLFYKRTFPDHSDLQVHALNNPSLRYLIFTLRQLSAKTMKIGPTPQKFPAIIMVYGNYVGKIILGYYCTLLDIVNIHSINNLLRGILMSLILSFSSLADLR